MPVYFCTAAEGRLKQDQKGEIAEAITKIYNEETGAPRYLVQVIFNEITPGNHFISGQVGSADQIWVRCDTRSGKTEAERKAMMRRILKDVATVLGTEQDKVAVLLSETHYSNITEFGHIAPAPGDEGAWFSSLPDSLQQRIKALA